MASTQYQIFCRYLNENSNHALTNKTTAEWISAEEMTSLTKFYEENKDEYESIKQQISTGVLRKNQLTVQQLNIYTQGQRYDEVQEKIEKEKIVIERCIVEPFDSLYEDDNKAKLKAKTKRDAELTQIVIDESVANNPKYDMVFLYDGIAYAESRTGEADYNPPDDDAKEIPYVYYERMKRIKLDPWFLFSTYASLNAAMAKARELVNLFGKDSVKIGKVVPLDQYIEIV